MFKGFKEFTYRMIAGANVATIVIMFLVGFSDVLSPEKLGIFTNAGLTFPLFLAINLCFSPLLVIVPSKICYNTICGISGMLCSCS